MNLFNLFENKEEYVLYFNGKPVAKFSNTHEAQTQIRNVKAKYPNTVAELRKEVCTLTPVELEENFNNIQNISEYKDYFKKPDQEPKQPVEKRFHGHEEYAEYKKKQQEKKQDKEKDVAEGSVGKIQPGKQIQVPDHWNKFDVVSEIAKKYGILADVEYSYDTRKWTITKARPMTAQDEKQMYTINGGIPQVDEQGVAEADKLQGTPVVSLSDFGDKDNTKDKYGRTVPRKLKKDDPRVRFHKDPKKPGVAEARSIIKPEDGIVALKKFSAYVKRNIVDLASMAAFTDHNYKKPYVDERFVRFLSLANGTPVTPIFNLGGRLELVGQNKEYLNIPTEMYYTYRGFMAGGALENELMEVLGYKDVAEQRIGPVTPVLSTQPTRTYPPQQVYVPTPTAPKSPPAQAKPYGGPKPAAIIDIQNQPISETVSGLDLADAIFKALDQLEGDVVRQYGHEVVGDAIMDVVDEYGEISNMSDFDLAVRDVLERLQKMNKGMSESRHYFKTIGTSTAELRNKFGLKKDNNGWFLSESNTNFKKLYLEATRTFTEYDLSQHTVSAATIGDDNFVSPVGSVPRGQQRIKKVKKNG